MVGASGNSHITRAATDKVLGSVGSSDSNCVFAGNGSTKLVTAAMLEALTDEIPLTVVVVAGPQDNVFWGRGAFRKIANVCSRGLIWPIMPPYEAPRLHFLGSAQDVLISVGEPGIVEKLVMGLATDVEQDLAELRCIAGHA